MYAFVSDVIPKMSIRRLLREKISHWWASTTLLERILMWVTLVSLILITMLITRKASCKSAQPPLDNTCKTQTCLKEATRVLLHIDPRVNPCDDFYKFACGNFFQNSDEVEAISREFVLQQIIDVYKQPISYSDHKMVKAAKRLFQTCLDEAQLERDGLKTIKEVLGKAGGWPVLEGSQWDEENFDWVKTTYRLKELGYYHSFFLRVDVVVDPEDINKHILQVSSYAEDLRHDQHDLDALALITDIALKFGAENVTEIQNEFDDIYGFVRKMNQNDHPYYIKSYVKDSFRKVTIEQYQQECESINWLDFINNIIGPKIQVTKDDWVLFPPPHNVTGWLEVISATSKRTQANYMIWKVLEDAVFYLGGLLHDTENNFKHFMTREEVCLRETQTKYQPNPIELIWYRKFLPAFKKQQLEKLLANVKLQLITSINETSWTDLEAKKKALQELTTLTTVIVQPGDYFDDQLLDDLDVDMMETNDETFLSLIAQAKRNQDSSLYQKLNRPPSEALTTLSNIAKNAGRMQYFDTIDTLFVPAIATHNYFFDEKRPNYLNYGAMGTLAGFALSEAPIPFLKESEVNRWSLQTQEAFKMKTKCPKKVDHNFTLEEMLLTHVTIGEQVAYEAYGEWVQKNGEEQRLAATDYTSKQLFWISAASALCQPALLYGYQEMFLKEPLFMPNIVVTSLRNNKNFAEDFQCPLGSKMNPIDKCQIL